MPETDTTATFTEPANDGGTTDTDQPAADKTDQSATDGGDLGDPGKQALDRMKTERNEARRNAKALEKELEDLRTQSMSDADKAVAEAEKRGRESATTELGKRLVRAEFDAVAGRRNPDIDTGGVLEFVDLARFVGDDGEPDAKAIKAAVERLVPAPQTGPPSIDGGTRTTAPAPAGMNGLIRKATGRA